MTPAERRALAEIQGLAGANRIVIQGHARGRMRTRRASYEDLRHALVTAVECRDQRADASQRADWSVRGGLDLDGEELNCAVDLDGQVVVVTVF